MGGDNTRRLVVDRGQFRVLPPNDVLGSSLCAAASLDSRDTSTFALDKSIVELRIPRFQLLGHGVELLLQQQMLEGRLLLDFSDELPVFFL